MLNKIPGILGWVFGAGLLAMLGSIILAGNFGILIPFANEIFMGFLAKAFLAFIGIIGIRLVLRWFDQLCDIQFKEWFQNVPPTHQAIYMGIRLFAFTLFFALILI